MTKKHFPIVIGFIFGILVTGISMYNYFKPSSVTPNQPPNVQETPDENSESLNLPTEGNNTVLTTNSKTTLRVINEYDNSFFTANKNLLIMFASWCPNCQEEINEIEKILDYYKNNKNVNVILIAHEFDNTVTDLIKMIENDVNFGDVEIKIDLGRVIRKTIDPEASTIPISYVVDKNGNILESFNDSLTLKKAIQMVGK